VGLNSLIGPLAGVTDEPLGSEALIGFAPYLGCCALWMTNLQHGFGLMVGLLKRGLVPELPVKLLSKGFSLAIGEFCWPRDHRWHSLVELFCRSCGVAECQDDAEWGVRGPGKCVNNCGYWGKNLADCGRAKQLPRIRNGR
jgi:hypothetical protein